MTTTPRGIIKASLALVRAIGIGEDIDGDEASDLFDHLNLMIDEWSSEGAMIYTDTLVSKALTVGTASYTLGPSGAINVSKPAYIRAAYVQDSSFDYPLKVIDERQYSRITEKTYQGRPAALFYKQGHPLATLILWPVPSSAMTLNLYADMPLTEFTGLSQALSLPPGYRSAMVYNLAKRVAGIYGKSLTMEQDKIANNSLRKIKTMNTAGDIQESMIITPFGMVGGSSLSEPTDGGGSSGGGGAFSDGFSDGFA